MAVGMVKYSWAGVTTASAPTLTGEAGSLIGVLDFALVTTLGWTKTALATNIAAYRQTAGDNLFYLYVNDTFTTAARVIGVEQVSGTAASDRVNPFPTEAQFSGGIYIAKSATANATVRPYFIWGDQRTVHITTFPDTLNIYHYFGDINSYRYPAQDIGACAIIGNGVALPGGTNAYGMWNLGGFSTAMSAHFLARPVTGLGGSATCNKGPQDYMRARTPSYELGGSGMPFPSPADLGLVVCKIVVAELASGPRGTLRGVYMPCHARPLPDGTTFTWPVGSALAGKDFQMVYGSNDGCFFAETSNTWDNTPD